MAAKNKATAVKLIESSRDAWQALPKAIPAEVKADYLRALVAAGFLHIDAVSFASPQAVPQMADAELVLEYLDAPPYDPATASGVEILGIVVDRQGAGRAIASGRVHTIGFPYSISETFLRRNQAQTPEEAVERMEEIGSLAQGGRLSLAGYCSMAFGNPYGDPWSIQEAVTACELMAESGAQVISLADTVGLATPAQVSELVGAVIASFGRQAGVEIGVHLHARPDGAPDKIRAAYEAGCRRFDSAIAGVGGCPFAQDALVGNLATETLLAELASLGAEIPKLQALDVLARAGADIQRKYGARVQ